MPSKASNFGSAAYGGCGWSPRAATLAEEIGPLWADCGVAGEWQTLRAVLLHQPGNELSASADPDAVQMLAPLHRGRAREKHAALAEAYRGAGVTVHDLAPPQPVRPNQMFLADLLFMTPEGAVLARPAASVLAGEERPVARRLAALGIPILRSLRGSATFEGVDAARVDRETA